MNGHMMYGNFTGKDNFERKGAQWDLLSDVKNQEPRQIFSDYANGELNNCTKFRLDDRVRVQVTTLCP